VQNFESGTFPGKGNVQKFRRKKRLNLNLWLQKKMALRVCFYLNCWLQANVDVKKYSILALVLVQYFSNSIIIMLSKK